jgi:anti-sigma B factor antagonist
MRPRDAAGGVQGDRGDEQVTHEPVPLIRGELRIARVVAPPWAILACEGDLDVTTSSELRTALRGEASDSDVIIDLDKVAFIDSTALGVLIAAQKRIQREGHQLRIVVSNPVILRILAITGLEDMFTICATRHDAGAPPA